MHREHILESSFSVQCQEASCKEEYKEGQQCLQKVHKVAIIVAETKQDLQLFDIAGGITLLNCLTFLGIWLNSANLEDMS